MILVLIGVTTVALVAILQIFGLLVKKNSKSELRLQIAVIIIGAISAIYLSIAEHHSKQDQAPPLTREQLREELKNLDRDLATLPSSSPEAKNAIQRKKSILDELDKIQETIDLQLLAREESLDLTKYEPPSGSAKIAILINRNKSRITPSHTIAHKTFTGIDYLKEFAPYIAARLQEHDIETIVLYRGEKKDIYERALKYNPKLILYLSENAGPENANGVESYYSENHPLAKTIASKMQSSIVLATGLHDRRVRSSSDVSNFIRLRSLENSPLPTVMTWLFFLSNRSDLEIALTQKKKLADAIVDSLKDLLDR